MKPALVGGVAFGLVSMAVAWAIFKNPPRDVDEGGFWAVVLLFAMPLFGFSVGALIWGSQLRHRRRGAGTFVFTGLGMLLLAAFALVMLWAAALTSSEH